LRRYTQPDAHAKNNCSPRLNPGQTRTCSALTEARIRPRIVALYPEHNPEAGIVGTPTPRLTWNIVADANWLQRSYEIASASESALVQSEASVLVSWPLSPLAPRELRDIRVRACEETGTWTPWSAAVTVEAALFSPDDWSASFVTPPAREMTSRDCPYFRFEFEVPGQVKRARLYASALGVYDAHLNGFKIGDAALAPGWTSYHSRLRYQTYDVTSQLRIGTNVIGAIVSEGWYAGRIGIDSHAHRELYGGRLAFLGQLEWESEDGRQWRVVTGPGWTCDRGGLVASSIYDGETFDARLEHPLWSSDADTATSAGAPVEIIRWPLERLVAQDDPPIRKVRAVRPVDARITEQGSILVDFGENLVGRLRAGVRGNPGDELRVRHAETLEGGNPNYESLRSAKAEDVYVGDGKQNAWEPRFTFHGFRYAEITSWPAGFSASDVEAVVVGSDLKRIGWFDCSDERLNRLHANIVRSVAGNFVGLPIDCPQRDERLGWTGDVQIVAPTACFLFDVAASLASWLEDLSREQAADGGVPHIVPNVFRSLDDCPAWATPYFTSPSSGWGDAAVIVPWVVYEHFGDAQILKRQWHSMEQWIEYVVRAAGPERVWQSGFHWGDFNAPASAAQTDPHLIATAYFARSTNLMARCAVALGLHQSAAKYSRLNFEVCRAFRAKFMRPSGELSCGTSTAYAMVLAFSLTENGTQRRYAAERLSELARENEHRAITGFLGTPLVCKALSDAGDLEAAYKLLLQDQCPSWLHPLSQDATTTWETWEAIQPDGSVTSDVSLNHAALGAVATWLHESVAGLAPASAGYKRIRICPLPGGELSHASARHVTPYGDATVAWEVDGDEFTLAAKLPPNTTADVRLPNDAQTVVGSGQHSWRVTLPLQTD
jgi:alpha-L-rhamnosidase